MLSYKRFQAPGQNSNQIAYAVMSDRGGHASKETKIKRAVATSRAQRAKKPISLPKVNMGDDDE